MPVGSDLLRDASIVVIGAGVVGAAVSYRLAQAGARVTTVERRYPGSGISSVSFAWVNSFNKRPREYHRLNASGLREHQDLADELHGAWLHVDGGLHWERAADTDRLAALRDNVTRLREWGTRVDVTTPEIAMREVAPDLWIDPDQVSEVYFCPREAWLETMPFAHGVLHAAITRYGARLERATVVGLHGPEGAVDAVVLDDGRQLAADVVVVCAGPDADRVVALAGAHLPIDRQIGMVVCTAPAPVCLKQVVRCATINLRPEGGSRLVLTHDQLDGYAVEGRATPTDAPEILDTLARARAVIPSLADVPAESVRFGLRALPGDGHSIIGFHPDVSGLYVVATHSGVTLAAKAASLVAEDLVGAQPEELAALRPDRFAVSARPGAIAATDE